MYACKAKVAIKCYDYNECLFSDSLGYTVNSASVPGDLLYIAGQPRYNHTGQVIIYRMKDTEIEILQKLSGEQVSMYYDPNLLLESLSLEVKKSISTSSLYFHF